jgi:alanine racemase
VQSSSDLLRPAWIDVHLDAIEANLAALRDRVRPAAVLAVVKADAYGHGAPEVGRALEAAGVEWLGVALVEEAAALRRAGVQSPILVLGGAAAAQLPLFRRYALTPAVSSLEQLEMWGAWARTAGGVQDLHLKFDTGMNRLGVPCEAAARALELVRGEPALRLTGVLSHLAEAEELGSPRVEAQADRFSSLLTRLEAAERERVWIHLGNSAAALHHPRTRWGLVRAGLALYGHDPAGRAPGLRPALELRAQIVAVRDLEPGDRVGYGGRFVAARPSRVAVVPVGYADGYSWRLSEQARALVGGSEVPVIGAISMDMLTLDVTGLLRSEAAVGTEVVLLGRQAGREISLAEFAALAGTLPYEVLCLLGLRLPRRYRRGGAVVRTMSRLFGGDR